MDNFYKQVSNSVFFDYDEDNYLLFHYPSFSMVKVEKKYEGAVIGLIQNKNDEDIINNNNLLIEELNDLKKNLQNTIFNTKYRFEKKEYNINRLTFLISNSCNLNCKYCYANEGSYNYPSQNMTIATAQAAIDFFVAYYKDIPNVMFFGGEAFLNIPVIEFICNYFVKLYNSKKINIVPHYAVVTNATLISSKTLDLIKKYNFSVTVSIDGDKAINDQLRVYRNGKGTFDKIIENIDKIKGIVPEENLCFEATYTNIHEKMGLSVSSVLKQIEGLTGIKRGVIMPVKGVNGNHKFVPEFRIGDSEYIELENENWDRLIRGEAIHNDEFKALLNRFIEKKIPRYICSIGFEAFTIAPNGDIFPCHMLTDGKKDNFNMGNVFEKEEYLFKKINEFSNKLSFFKKTKNQKCLNCFAIGLCGFCPALEIGNNEFNIPDNFDYYCNRAKENVKSFILKMASIRDDDKKWKNLQKSIELTFA